jgi:hypothetical protein
LFKIEIASASPRNDSGGCVIPSEARNLVFKNNKK